MRSFPTRRQPAASPLAGGLPSLLVLLVLVAAPHPAFAATIADYFPLTPGAIWRYTAGQSQVDRSVVPQPQTFHGTTTYGLRTTLDGQFVETLWWSSSAGLRVHRMDDSDSASPRGARLREPLTYAPATFTAGGVYPFQTAYSYVDAGMPEPTEFEGTIQGTSRITGPESITTAAGTFSCYRVSVEETWSEFGEVVYVGSTTFWLASGTGPVRITYSSGVTLDLQSFSTPAGTSPAITTQPVSQTVQAGATVTFSIQASGTAPLSYQWRKDGQALTGATQASLTLTAVSESDNGAYTVEVSNPNGKTLSQTATLTVQPVAPTPRPALTQWRRLPAGDLEVTFTAATGKTWLFETSDDLQTWSVIPAVTANGPGTRSLGPLGAAAQRFFRMREGVPPPTGLLLPEPGKLYPGGTRLGGDLFGFEFTLPAAWQGGLRVNSPWMLFGSDTQPGLILGLLGFAGTQEELLQDTSLREGFESELDANTKLFFRATRPIAASGNHRLSAGFSATGADGTAYALNLELVVHPSGGFLGFLGLTTQAQIAGLQTQLLGFVDSVRTPVRNTHVEYLTALPGRSFKWESGGNEWYSGNWQGSASSTSWSENYAFFCADGTFEINKESTSYVGTRNSTGWSSTYMSLSYGSSTKEYGQFTVIQHPQHGSLMLIATLAGYQITPIQLRPDGSLLLGKNLLAPHQPFTCR